MKDFLGLIVLLRSQEKPEREALLKIGAAGQLFLSGELKGVLPLDDEETLNAAKPDQYGKLSPIAQEAREDAQVRRLVRGSGVSVILLGAQDDLSDNVQKLDLSCELVVVTSESVDSE